MELSSLSSMPHRPCLLMKCAKATILLDTAVNLETLAAFHPQTMTGRYKSPILRDTDLNASTRKVSLSNFIDAVPEVQPVSFADVETKDIDAILISNWSSLFALPFITERAEFHGAVFCTIPTKELGGLVMQEFTEFMSHVKAEPIDTKKPIFMKNDDGSPTFDIKGWSKVFTKDEIEKCLNRITPISLGETKLVNGIVKCTAFSSGYSIGSCNWLIEVESTKFGYIAVSSAKSTHMRPCDWQPFRDLDYLALTSLTLTPDPDPYKVCNIIKSTMADALKKGGNVLFPINPIGYLFDLLEVVLGAIEEYQIPRDVPVYLISPCAASTIAFINTYTEWLKKEKAAKVYNPEEPFVFSELVRENRIKVYDSISGAFSKDYKSPCIVFTGHPTLHIGNVVNFLELWGQDKKSVVISTDPEYSLMEMYKPFRDLQIRRCECQIETRLDMRFVNETLLPDLKPKTLIVTKEYIAKPGSRLTNGISYKNLAPLSYGDNPQTFKVASRKRALIQDELLKTLKIEPKRAKLSACTLRGFLSTYDNDFEILKSAKPDAKNKVPGLPSQKHTGILTPDNLIKALSERGIKAEYGDATAGECLTVRIPKLKAEVRIESGGLKSRICCNAVEDRRKIQRILVNCLEEM